MAASAPSAADIAAAAAEDAAAGTRLRAFGSASLGLEERLEMWYHGCDGAGPLHTKQQLNEMHVLGAKLCSDLDRGALWPGGEATYETFDVVAAFAAFAPMPFEERLLCRLDWQQLTDMMTTLQLEYKRLIVWDAATGWAAYFDYCPFVLCVLKRMGYWIRRSWRTAADDNDNNGTGTDADAEALHGTVTVDAAGWRTLATPALAALLDAVHTFAALTNRLLSATLVAEPDASTRVELHAHHREASLDDYYVNAMLADLPLGSIVQYAHRFQFLFHSITQVVYFHWPSYKRLAQRSLAELRAADAPSANVLPLLQQIDPGLPVLSEHTRALCHTRATTAAAPWAWMNVGGFFALLHADGSSFVARDVRELYLFYLARCDLPQKCSDERAVVT